MNLDSLQTIPSGLFSGRTALESVSLAAVTSIGNEAFQGCASPINISPPLVTSIGGSTFSGCTSLTSMSLPAATSIGDYAFSGYTSLTSVTLPATAPTKGSSIFASIGSSSAYKPITIRVPSGSVGNYSTSVWPRGNTTAYGGYVNVTFVEY